MKKTSYHILRIGLAITFLWIGILILKMPHSWGGYLQPWAVRIIPFSIEEVMIITAILDIIVGFLLLVDLFTFIAALLATIHLALVLLVSGITDITVRDIGLLAAAIVVMIESLPQSIISIFLKKDIS